MAHTNETANYDLSQFIGTDIPNPLTDYNGDMLKIDTALAQIATASTAYEARVTALEIQNGSETLETTAQTLSGGVNEVNADVADLTSRMTVAEGKITTDESTLATAVSNISTLAGKVSAVETQNGSEVLDTTSQTLSGAVNELKAEIDGQGVSSLTSRVTALETQAGSEVLTTTAQTLSGAINELAGSGMTVDSAMSSTSENAVQNKVIKAYVDGKTEYEIQTGSLAVGDTSVTLTFTEQPIGSDTLIDVYTDTFGVNPTNVTYTASTVVLTFDTQESAVGVSVKVMN